jgi:Ternary complex associated domain 9
MADLEDLIIADVFDNSRLFLPGGRCTPERIREHFLSPILYDSLTLEESYLILSTLPNGSARIYIAPLDKGLSTAKVFAAKYDIDGYRVSRRFVIKVGPKAKVRYESEAVEKFVAPYIQGVSQPIYREGPNLALIGQDLVGLGRQERLRSLREYVRESNKADSVVDRLLSVRLGPWYDSASSGGPKLFSIEELFKWHLRKAGVAPLYPEEWLDLQSWVEAETGCSWGDVAGLLRSILAHTISSPQTIVHGDLHSMNILVDEHEEVWPIDFGWCRDNSSPILDLVMLECSLKFIAMPRRSALRALLRIEVALEAEPFPNLEIGKVPYASEIRNVLSSVFAVRRFAIEKMEFSFDDYRKALFIMTYAHRTHPSLNQPFVLGSLQIISSKMEPVND